MTTKKCESLGKQSVLKGRKRSRSGANLFASTANFGADSGVLHQRKVWCECPLHTTLNRTALNGRARARPVVRLSTGLLPALLNMTFHVKGGQELKNHSFSFKLLIPALLAQNSDKNVKIRRCAPQK